MRLERLALLNRGEAALRAIRSVKALRGREGSDLRAIALYTDVDRDAPFVRHADEAVRLPGGGGEVAAYLDHDRVLRALRAAEADAVWPGWGFLAEDPDFVERLEREGLRFLGPSADAMRRLGDKIEAKRLAEACGVPVPPWSGGAVADEAAARTAAERLGYPLVVKASAGGGGRGIRVVEAAEALDAAFRSASAEAGAAFGDPRVFLERRVARGRHVEVQVVADREGCVRTLGCRDCSVQRRHQKVIEEAPAPGLPAELRSRLEEAAARIAAGAGYEGVGTVEFLVDGEAIHFLEVNPRLQVEHGVTEEVTGCDLVELQIRIARGESVAGLEVVERGAALEARVCAEDPDAGFAPAPGRIACFDPSLGPRVRVDSGVATGSRVPPSFDSLVAKVIATGETREEALGRLGAALSDLDLVIEGGATNRGWLTQVLAHPDFRRGGVDTGWLDRVGPALGEGGDHAAEALVAAAILSYQRARAAARLQFYADPANPAPQRVPQSRGQRFDLAHRGRSYRVAVFAVGSWRYRVHLDGRVAAATLREESPHVARLVLGGRTLRVLYDATESGLRVEVEGSAHRFGSSGAGRVYASTPAMVVAVDVKVGDSVRAGERLGLLEAMKMEVGFEAPVSGVVREVCARPGMQVAAGEVLLVVDPSAEGEAPAGAARIRLPEGADPLERALGRGEAADLRAVDAAAPEERRRLGEAVRDEVRRVLLGYDAHPERADHLAAFLEAPLPEELSEPFRWELAAIRHEVVLFADVARLFARSPHVSATGEVGPSNSARLRMYVRRIRAGGAGIAPAFLDLLRRALGHYGITSLEPGDALERAVLRLLASQREPVLRDRLVLAMLRRLGALARRAVPLREDEALADALAVIAGLRGLVPDALADAAVETRYLVFDRPEVERHAERTGKQVERWLAEAEARPAPPPPAVLRHLADAPRAVFDRVGRWLDDPDPRRRAIALAAHGRRAYSPLEPVAHESLGEGEGAVDRLALPDGRHILSAAGASGSVAAAAARLVAAAERERETEAGPAVFALELFVKGASDALPEASVQAAVSALGEGAPCARFTLSRIDPRGRDVHRTFEHAPGGYREVEVLHGLHPETAARVELGRLARFELERLPAAEGLYGFHARAWEDPSDERIFVLADLRSRSPEDGHEQQLHEAAFEHLFHEATRFLRASVAERDPRRRLQWNRITLHVARPVLVEPGLPERLAHRLHPHTRHLGLEKVVVRLRALDPDAPHRPGVETEIVIADPTGSRMTLERREPRRVPIAPVDARARRLARARRRGLLHPDEVVRLLTEGGGGAEAPLPLGRFEEYELDPDVDAPRARPAAPRAPGANAAGVVFGVISTPTEKVPEGMERVLLLSDPTRDLGALAGPECDRIVAALDLAEARGLPVEWVAISSGARIAMESGTENLDATARVARRIVTFTQGGGVLHVIVPGVNVGAQSYFDALATMLMHTRGALIMTPGAAMVLTGRAALEVSGGVSAEDETAIGGFERVMGPNGEAQYPARDLVDAFRILFDHYRYTYVVPGEAGPRPLPTRDPAERSVCDAPAPDSEVATVGDLFDDEENPDRKRPFAMRDLMRALVDRDGGWLERWRAMAGAETAIVWDAHLGGQPVCLIGMESRSVAREGYRPTDGPPSWTGGTLFPHSSKKVARALNAASGNRPAVVLANLSGFDGSPESMRRLQLEYGAEIARAVVNFEGPILFLVVSRYHGGAYVVFSRALHPRLRAAALRGSFASVIGGGAAARVVFAPEVRARVAADPRIREAEGRAGNGAGEGAREQLDRTRTEVALEKQAEIAAEFDAVHTVERARRVGSLEAVVEPRDMRAFLVGWLAEEGLVAASSLSS